MELLIWRGSVELMSSFHQGRVLVRLSAVDGVLVLASLAQKEGGTFIDGVDEEIYKGCVILDDGVLRYKILSVDICGLLKLGLDYSFLLKILLVKNFEFFLKSLQNFINFVSFFFDDVLNFTVFVVFWLLYLKFDVLLWKRHHHCSFHPHLFSFKRLRRYWILGAKPLWDSAFFFLINWYWLIFISSIFLIVVFLESCHVRSNLVLIDDVLLLDGDFLFPFWGLLKIIKLLLTLLELIHQTLNDLVLSFQFFSQILSVRACFLHSFSFFSRRVNFWSWKVWRLEFLWLLRNWFIIDAVVFVLMRWLDFSQRLVWLLIFVSIRISILECWLCRSVLDHKLALWTLSLRNQFLCRSISKLLLIRYLN